MQTDATVDEVLHLARRLSPLDKLKLIERLAPDLEAALSPVTDGSKELDDQYQRGYEQFPEDVADLEALLPHLAIPTKLWE